MSSPSDSPEDSGSDFFLLLRRSDDGLELAEEGVEVEVEGTTAGVLTMTSSLLGLFLRLTVALSAASVF